MKGKSGTREAKSHTAYSGGNSSVASEMMKPTGGFKKGGKVGMMHGGMKSGGMKTGGMKAEGVMSEAHAGRKPRKSGGSVMSSASGGTPRGKGANY
jgi:hypothetical protein